MMKWLFPVFGFALCAALLMQLADAQSAGGFAVCFPYQKDCIHYPYVSNPGCNGDCNWKEADAECNIGDQSFFVQGMDLMLYPKNSYLTGKARLRCHVIR